MVNEENMKGFGKMNINKCETVEEAIEFFRTLFKGNVIIDGINLSEDTIQELIIDKLDLLEKAIIKGAK